MKRNFSRKILALTLSFALLLNSGAVAFATGGADGAASEPVLTAGEPVIEQVEKPSLDEPETVVPPSDEKQNEGGEQGNLSDPGEDANESDCTCNPAIGTSGVEGHGKDCPFYEAPSQPECTCPPVDSGEVVHLEGCPRYVAEKPALPEQSDTAKAALALIAALPTMEELAAMDTEAPEFADYLAQLRLDTAAARVAYDALTDEQKAAFDADALAKLTALEEVLAAMPVLMAEGEIPLDDTVDKLVINTTYTIADAAQLDNLSALVKAKQTGFDATIKLLNDVTANDTFVPIGINTYGYQFGGTFDGGDHVVTLNLTGTTADYQGLFGYVGVGGTVQNVGVAGTVSGKDYVGGVVGENSGTVQDCSNSATVSGNAYVGGVVGYSSSIRTMQNCYNTGTVTGTGDYVGGVVGENRGTMQNCSNSATVSGTNKVGGVVGGNSSSSGKVQNCYNTGAVIGTKQVGGVVGYNSGTVQNCHNTGTITGTGSGEGHVGGVVGYNSSATVQNCYNTGAVSGTNGVGGVVGDNFSATVQNCYNTGAVSGTNQVGGVVGNNSDTVQNCVSLGASVKRTSGTGTDFGRVVGKNSDTLTGNKARSDMLVLGATVTSADATSINGADVIVGDSTTQADVFDGTAFSDTNGWNTISGNLAVGAALPTLTGFTAAQNPTLPEGEAVTPTGHTCNNITFDKSVPTSGDVFPAGNYFLDGDVTVSANLLVKSGTTVNLCLNGHTLTASNPNEGGGNYSSITVQPNGTLNIYDCSAGNTGKITGGSALNGGCINNEGTLNLYGGTITGNTATYSGGGVYNANANLTLYGKASITGNTKKSATGESNLWANASIKVGSPLTGTIGITRSPLPTTNPATVAVAADGYTLTEDDASCFVSDVPGYTIKLDGTNVVMEKIVPQASWVVTGGATGQGTLTEAIAAVKATGGTVTLLTDVGDEDSLATVEIDDTFSKPITLVLNGKTLTGMVFIVENPALFTIDGTAAGSKITSPAEVAIACSINSKLNLKGGTYTGGVRAGTQREMPAIMMVGVAQNDSAVEKLKTLLADGYKFEDETGFKVVTEEGATAAVTGKTVKVVPKFTPINGGVTFEDGNIYANGNALTVIEVVGGRTNIYYTNDPAKKPIDLSTVDKPDDDGSTENGFKLTWDKVYPGLGATGPLLFGGSKTKSVGDVVLNLEGGLLYHVYGSGGDSTTRSLSTASVGNITINASGTGLNSGINTSGYNGTVTGDVTVNITNGTVTNLWGYSTYGTVVGNVRTALTGGQFNVVIVPPTLSIGGGVNIFAGVGSIEGINIKGGTRKVGVEAFAISSPLQQMVYVNLPENYTGGTIATGAVAGDLEKIKLAGEGATDATMKLEGSNIVVTVGTTVKVPVTGVTLNKTTGCYQNRHQTQTKEQAAMTISGLFLCHFRRFFT